MKTTLGAVVPTRNRPDELYALLRNLAEQTRKPDTVVVVDGSDPELDCEDVARAFRNLMSVRYLHYHPPSAAAQRNAGIAALMGAVGLIALVDDDVVLESDALENACAAVDALPQDVVGFGLNRTDEEAARPFGKAKRSALTRALGLYSNEIGAVTLSGWHTRLVTVDRLTEVNWLATGAAVWRASVFEKIRFDEYFEQYSYLEDLELSLQAWKVGRLVVLPNARYEHRPAEGGRKSRFWFGRIEVRNRHYIVTKHGLSRLRFWMGMLIRMSLTVGEVGRGKWREGSRLMGNVVEMGNFLARRNKYGGVLH